MWGLAEFIAEKNAGRHGSIGAENEQRWMVG